jgi:Spy/CpxP family protein refolding chaperone
MKRTIIAVALTVFAATAAFAQPGPRNGGGELGPRGNNSALAEYLSLTSSQKTSWQTIQSELHTTVQALHEQQRTLHEQLQAALEGTDASAIGTLMLQIRALREQIEAARDAADAKFAALLTTEQQTKFAAFQAAAEFLGQRGQDGPGRPGPR